MGIHLGCYLHLIEFVDLASTSIVIRFTYFFHLQTMAVGNAIIFTVFQVSVLSKKRYGRAIKIRWHFQFVDNLIRRAAIHCLLSA